MGTCSRTFTESKRTYSGSGEVVVFCGCGNKVRPEALFSQVGEYPNLKAREINQIKVELALNSLKVGSGQLEFHVKRGTTWCTSCAEADSSPNRGCVVGVSVHQSNECYTWLDEADRSTFVPQSTTTVVATGAHHTDGKVSEHIGVAIAAVCSRHVYVVGAAGEETEKKHNRRLPSAGRSTVAALRSCSCSAVWTDLPTSARALRPSFPPPRSTPIAARAVVLASAWWFLWQRSTPAWRRWGLKARGRRGSRRRSRKIDAYSEPQPFLIGSDMDLEGVYRFGEDVGAAIRHVYREVLLFSVYTQRSLEAP